jgi:hypothetical protein
MMRLLLSSQCRLLSPQTLTERINVVRYCSSGSYVATEGMSKGTQEVLSPSLQLMD